MPGAGLMVGGDFRRQRGEHIARRVRDTTAVAQPGR
jgi:hypothetical protein